MPESDGGTDEAPSDEDQRAACAAYMAATTGRTPDGRSVEEWGEAFEHAVETATLATCAREKVNVQVFTEMVKLCGLGMASMKALGGK